MAETPEGVYRAAAEAVRPLTMDVDALAANPRFRAAVATGYAAGRKDGYGQGRDDEANGEPEPTWLAAAAPVDATDLTLDDLGPHDDGGPDA